MTTTFINAFYEPFARLEEALVHPVAPYPCGMRCLCSTNWLSDSGNVATGKEYKSCTRQF